MDCSPIPLRTGGSTSAASLYLVHDGSGLCYMFSQLHDLGRDLYGFSNPGLFDADDQPSSLIQMAARYASDIDTSAERPVILGGMWLSIYSLYSCSGFLLVIFTFDLLIPKLRVFILKGFSYKDIPLGGLSHLKWPVSSSRRVRR